MSMHFTCEYKKQCYSDPITLITVITVITVITLITLISVITAIGSQWSDWSLINTSVARSWISHSWRARHSNRGTSNAISNDCVCGTTSSSSWIGHHDVIDDVINILRCRGLRFQCIGVDDVTGRQSVDITTSTQLCRLIGVSKIYISCAETIPDYHGNEQDLNFTMVTGLPTDLRRLIVGCKVNTSSKTMLQRILFQLYWGHSVTCYIQACLIMTESE